MSASTQNTNTKITLGFSPCPSDCFMFDAMIHHKIDTEGLSFNVVLEDVEALNQQALKGALDITKLSFHAFYPSPENHKHWFRAKFFQQYRLFFRFHSESKIIVLAWVNDEKTKRAYNSKSDAYRVFEKMLNNGNPPDDWSELIAEAKDC